MSSNRPIYTPRGPGNPPKEYEVICTCGAPMRMTYSTKFKDSPWFYGCSTFPKCRQTHGCHQATGKPLGRPADKETKNWRMKAHDAFDTLWQKKGMGRAQAYKWMRRMLDLSEEEAHIGMMNIETCQRLIVAVWNFKGGKK